MQKTRVRVSLVAALLSPLLFLLPTIAFADTVTVNFEPSTYTLGSIQSQDGWGGSNNTLVNGGTINPSYDQEVVSSASTTGGYNYTTFGTQSLRMSDAVTSGSFGDWVFSKPLTDEAGETAAVGGGLSGGTRQKHFEAQFDIASALPGQVQTGLHMSVSPDRGDGARMSYLRFEDQSTGIHVFFDDATDPTFGAAATFNETDIATLDRTKAHTVELTIDFIDGPGNDVVKVYIDGTLRHIGTTWEDYYRNDPEQAGGGNQVPTVDSLIFQSRTGSGPVTNPADSGHGFLIDNLSLESGPSPVITNNTVVVTQNDLETNLANAATSGKWYFFDDTSNVLNNALGSFVTGPSTPPRGTGSAEVTLADATSRVFLTNSAFGGKLLSTISVFGFSEDSHSGSGVSATEVPFVRFNVDFTGSNGFQGSLVYEPTDNGTITQNGWQTWDMIKGGNAKWQYTNHTWPTTTTGPDAGVVGQSGNTARTWNAIIADYPSIQMLASGPQVGVRFGEPGPAGYIADTDAFIIGFGTTATTYDFDPAVTPPPAAPQVHIFKYVDNVPATASNTNSAVFPMLASWVSTGPNGTATNVPFTLSPTGWGSTDAAYEASYVGGVAGDSYATNEVTGGPVVGTSCAGGTPFVLAGYSTGDTLQAAFTNASSTASPNFSDLQKDEYVIVWNKSCAVPPPPQCNINATANIVSDTLTQVDGHSAVAITPNPAWVLFSGSTWIYSDALNANGSSPTGIKIFTRTFNIVGTPSDSSLTIAADNMYTVSVNGHAINTGTSGTDLNNFSSTATWAIPAADLLTGSNTITFTVTNPANDPATNQPFGDPNPGGLLYKLTINNNECVTPVTGTASISGSKFEDWDGDGSPFETKWEDGLSGWTIYLDINNNQTLDAGDISTTTGKNGAYKFTGLVAGTYHVREVQKAGWTQTYPSANAVTDQWTVTLTDGQAAKKKDFGNFELGSISGMKFNDINGNHKKDGGEPELQGWTIKIKGNNGYASSTVTDVTGHYNFINLPAGNYVLSEVMQTGWRQTVHPTPVHVYSDTSVSNKNFGNTQKTKGRGDNDSDDDYTD